MASLLWAYIAVSLTASTTYSRLVPRLRRLRSLLSCSRWTFDRALPRSALRSWLCCCCGSAPQQLHRNVVPLVRAESVPLLLGLRHRRTRGASLPTHESKSKERGPLPWHPLPLLPSFPKGWVCCIWEIQWSGGTRTEGRARETRNGPVFSAPSKINKLASLIVNST